MCGAFVARRSILHEGTILTADSLGVSRRLAGWQQDAADENEMGAAATDDDPVVDRFRGALLAYRISVAVFGGRRPTNLWFAWRAGR